MCTRRRSSREFLYGLRFSWDGYRTMVTVQTRDGRVVDQIDIGGGPGGGPSIGRSRMSFDALCDLWMHRRGLRPATPHVPFTPAGPEPPAQPRLAPPPPRSPAVRRTRLLLAAAVVVVLGLVTTVVLVLVRSDMGDVALGTWSCATGRPRSQPVDVIVGDGTYTIPSQGIRGRWEITDGRLTTTSEADPRPGGNAGAAFTVLGIPEDLNGPLSETLQVSEQRVSGSPAEAEPVPTSYANGRFVYGEGRSAITCVKR